MKTRVKLESFPSECRKATIKPITTANQNKGRHGKKPLRTQRKRI